MSSETGQVMRVDDPCRIVITGIGLCTPFGPDRESSWQGILSGDSATVWLGKPFWTGDTPIAGAPMCWPPSRAFLHPEPLVELALTTATEAIADAGLCIGKLEGVSTGVVFGTSKGGFHSFARMMSEPQNVNDPTSPIWSDVFPNRPALAISNLIGSDGPSLCPVLACATGLAACLRGVELIRNGDCDIVLAGSADASLQPALIGSFRRLGVLSRETTIAHRACRPFDIHRSGFVIGEGAACLVLERLDSAIARKANCYAEWNAGLLLSDSYGLTQLDPDGTSLIRLLSDLQSNCPCVPDYINLHGTGTVTNDRIECRAIQRIFSDQVNKMAFSSLKGGMGHLLGAAGSVELAATALAISNQVVPPTVNLIDPDPDCSLRFCTNAAKFQPIDHAWKISMGFGGHIAGACLSRLDQDKI